MARSCRKLARSAFLAFIIVERSSELSRRDRVIDFIRSLAVSFRSSRIVVDYARVRKGGRAERARRSNARAIARFAARLASRSPSASIRKCPPSHCFVIPLLRYPLCFFITPLRRDLGVAIRETHAAFPVTETPSTPRRPRSRGAICMLHARAESLHLSSSSVRPVRRIRHTWTSG